MTQQKYAVFGNPIKQSRSPYIHQQFAAQTSQAIEYTTIEAPLDQFAAKTAEFFQAGGMGANVTVPFKEQAFDICAQVSARAKQAGAVNTLIKRADGQVHGDNCEGIGLVGDLFKKKVVLAGANILLLGAGGASRGVIMPLLDQKPTGLIITNRTLSKAQALVDEFAQTDFSAASGEQLSDTVFDVVINATSAGLSGHVPNIPSQCLSEDTVCYDMVYAKDTTAFNLWAEQNGVKTTYDGLGMLVEQAAESFRLWRNVEPDTHDVLAALRRDL